MIHRAGLLILILLIALAPLVAQEEDPYLIELGSVSFSPAAGPPSSLPAGHFILQFHDTPSQAQFDRLKEMGIDIQRPVGGTAYIARCADGGSLAELSHIPDIRTAVAITPAMRRHPWFETSPKLRKAVTAGENIAVDVRFHPDVSIEIAMDLMLACGLTSAGGDFLYDRRLIVEGPWSSIEALLHADEVDQVHPALLEYSLMNLASSKRMHVGKVLRKAKFHKPSGDGVLVGVTDAWTVDENHPEFEGRVIILHDTRAIPRPDNPGNIGHATMVAGGVASAGIIKPKSRGIAPGARILSMVIPFDPVGEIQYARDNFGLQISFNSWSYNPIDHINRPPVRIISTSVSPAADSLASNIGHRHNFINAMDKMVRKADVLYLWAAGNDSSTNVLIAWPDETGKIKQPDAWHRTNAIYDQLTVSANAKNILAIGATHLDDVIAGFSSRGPAYDGRLAPQLVAPGSPIFSTGPNQTYGVGQGTSGSTPLAAGAAALLIEQYRGIHKFEPGSALLKAIMINSARDLGPEGPDYTFGYGMVDAQQAALTIGGQEGIRETTKILSRFIEDSVKNKQVQKYKFTVPDNQEELRITLVWHDPPGAKLINDLDLYARYGSGGKILPLTLNPNRPKAPAVNKRNIRDNHEHVLVKNPQAGEWTIVVKGRRIPKGRQDYALVIASGRDNQEPVRKTQGDFTFARVLTSKGDPNIPSYTFNIGDPLYLHALINVHDNALYPAGNYGTITSRFEFRNASGVLCFVLSWSWSFMGPTQPGETRDIQMRAEEIPEGIPPGTYRIKTIVFMHNGITKTAPEEVIITIQ